CFGLPPSSNCRNVLLIRLTWRFLTVLDRDIEAMLRNLTFCLAVVGVGFGIATGSAAAIDREQAKASSAAGVVPAEGKFSSGFSAIKSPGSQNLKEGSSAEAQD